MFDPSPAPVDTIAVFVAARYPAIRAGLRALLEGEDGIAVLADGAIDDLAGDVLFDVLLADLLDGDDAALAEAYHETPAVLLSGWDADLAASWMAGVARSFLPSHGKMPYSANHIAHRGVSTMVEKQFPDPSSPPQRAMTAGFCCHAE